MSIGKLSYVDDLRVIWQHEERDFTPWLSEHIGLLGEALSLDLEVVSVEHGVGAFSLDILAKESGSGNMVAIENQLEITDHSHLGQILTYASGVEAKTVVWISKEVRDEHRKAIDWLNEVTNDQMSFFAIEVQLIKIDESRPAPFFKVKASPNDWSKVVGRPTPVIGEMSDRRMFYHDFFGALLERVQKIMPGLTNSKKVGYDSWKSFPAGVGGYAYAVAFRSGNRLSCELYIDTGEKDLNKERFDMLETHKESIEMALGKLSWERLDDRRACRIALYTTEIRSNEEMLEWGVSRLKIFREVFKKHIS